MPVGAQGGPPERSASSARGAEASSLGPPFPGPPLPWAPVQPFLQGSLQPSLRRAASGHRAVGSRDPREEQVSLAWGQRAAGSGGPGGAQQGSRVWGACPPGAQGGPRAGQLWVGTRGSRRPRSACACRPHRGVGAGRAGRRQLSTASPDPPIFSPARTGPLLPRVTGAPAPGVPDTTSGSRWRRIPEGLGGGGGGGGGARQRGRAGAPPGLSPRSRGHINRAQQGQRLLITGGARV